MMKPNSLTKAVSIIEVQPIFHGKSLKSIYLSYLILLFYDINKGVEPASVPDELQRFFSFI